MICVSVFIQKQPVRAKLVSAQELTEEMVVGRETAARISLGLASPVPARGEPGVTDWTDRFQ